MINVQNKVLFLGLLKCFLTFYQEIINYLVGCLFSEKNTSDDKME